MEQNMIVLDVATDTKENSISIPESAAIKAIAVASDVDENDVSMTIATLSDWLAGAHAAVTKAAADILNASDSVTEVKVKHNVGDIAYKDVYKRSATKSKVESFGSPNRVEYTEFLDYRPRIDYSKFLDHRPRIDYSNRALSENIDSEKQQAEKFFKEG